MRCIGVLGTVVVLGLGGVACTNGSDGVEGPPDLLNGDFESGDLTGWSTASWGAGEWLVYEDGSTPPVSDISDKSPPFGVPNPPQGRFAAVTDMDENGVRFLYRDIEVTGPWTLHATVFYENHDEDIHDPPDFGVFVDGSWATGPHANQQYRIDLVRPEAELHSLEPDDVLATVFRTEAEGATAQPPTVVSIDLSPWKGQVVRLRAGQIDNLGPLRAGLDEVRLTRSS